MIQDRARRPGGSGQLTELAGQRSNASSERGPATGHGVTARLRQPKCTSGLILTQRHKWIHARGAPGRQIAGDE